ncbi:type I-E CRISPR-associated protein Cas7/Cse4/CasC [Streptomyces durbertensis]|uniref:Type I-E CRISPR-associated protein Cas7/Cse4/CasC n=1 Tax=Streptomyces durbertensis TaxID=2448886 RepID=A0ABR6EG75_9ACTN|nr:type I-E CRISPR-associated protein Cas7/Cse4/CasC [Streptomyces durbertensis]MBB1244327.1 type I-E CRISPR-associated protein Cas7/Cse4/CasC [Streptomyces durbertensis]
MTSPLYIDVHIVQTVPPANMNRDDQGAPKEAVFGGVRRSRVSSQAWKHATRRDFDGRLPEPERASRTKRIIAELADRIDSSSNVGHEQAERIATVLLAQLGISKGKKAGDTAYLLFYGHAQLDEVAALVHGREEELASLDDAKMAEEVKELPVAEKFQSGHPVAVALFGRMVADIPKLNVDAAVQVAHALSTHEVHLEFDYFTAVDDKNPKEETGAAHIDSVGFNSATLYRYATVGFHQLAANLGGDADAALDAVEQFVLSFTRSAPTGYQNSFAHRTLPSVVAVVVRGDQPVNLVSAFEDPVPSEAGIQAVSARRLADEHSTALAMWGDKPLYTAVSHTYTDDASRARTQEAAQALTRAFGESQPMADLLAGLRKRLAQTTSTEEK